jgi:hypothetical protein
MKKRIGPLCSACIEAKEVHGFGDGGHACTCDYPSDALATAAKETP